MSCRILFYAAVLAFGIGLSACSDKDEGALHCPSGPADTLLVYPRLEFAQINVTGESIATPDHDPGMAGMESLYLGSDGETRSDILVNFDFGSVISEEYPPEFFVADSIQAVYLTMHRLLSLVAYSGPNDVGSDTMSFGPMWPGVAYHVRPLASPFVPQDYSAWPGTTPPAFTELLNEGHEFVDYSEEPRIRMPEARFLEWVRNGEPIGLMIQAGADSDTGLVGFASRELTTLREVSAIYEGSSTGPSLVVHFSGRGGALIIPSQHDTSTFDQINELPPELMHVQTGLRTVPLLSYDIPPLPDDSCLRSYGFRATMAAMAPQWPDECVALSQVDPARVDWSSGTVSATALQDGSLTLMQICSTGPGSKALDFSWSGEKMIGFPDLPETMHLMLNFNDSTINRYSQPYDYFIRYQAHMYFSQSTIFGPAAALEDRPVLMLITG